MPADLHTYDPLQIVVVFAGNHLQGYADSSFVKVERSEDTWSDQVGADGQVTRVRSRNKTGNVTLTLVAASATNQILAGIIAAAENSTAPIDVGTLSIRDLNGLDLHTAEKAWLKRPANAEYAKDAGTREWMFRCAELITNSGGSVL